MNEIKPLCAECADERWVVVATAPMYSISSAGRVRSALTGRVLKPWTSNKNGHLSVSLGRKLRRTVHTLVADAFLGAAKQAAVRP